jgi:hypothetical protein
MQMSRFAPNLATYPFTPKEIEIRIFLYGSDGSELAPEKLHVLALREGKLTYHIQGLPGELLPTIHKESYEEAKAALEQSRAKLHESW